jgi:hypothetical protein
MNLDIRLPIGWLFSLIGALLLAYGIAVGPPAAGAAAGLNVDAWWGGCLLVFGLFMWRLARR